MSLAYLIEFITNPQALITAFGLMGIFAIVFLETGFFFGFFLPGDSLLFTAGLFAAQGYLPITWLAIGVFLAAIAGDSVGYSFGKRIGPTLFNREDSTFFKKEYLTKAQAFYASYGARTLIIARFVPVVRTFAPIVAGIGNMKYKTFFIFNVVGAFLWVFIVIGLGYGFGRVIPDPDRFILPAVLVIVVLSILPGVSHIFRKKS